MYRRFHLSLQVAVFVVYVVYTGFYFVSTIQINHMMFGDIPTTQPWERDRIFALVPRPDAGDLGYWQWQHIQTVSGDDSLTFWWAKTC